MWNYYIATRALWQKHLSGFHQSACTDHEGGAIVLVAAFRTTADQDLFESEPGVTPFPRVNAADPIGAALAAKLAGFSALSSLGILATHSTFDVAMRLRKHFPPFDPRREE